MIERDDTGFEDWPPAVDPIRTAVGQLICALMEAIPEGPARGRVVGEVLELHTRVAALISRCALN